jgi:tRNA A-37 threonylcarbamoyl transferase component Bud32
LNTQGYETLRYTIQKIKKLLLIYIDGVIPNNDIRINEKLASHIIYDVLYDYIINNSNYFIDNDPDTENIGTIDDELENNNDFIKLYEPIYLLVRYCVKGINTRKITFSLMNDIKNILDCFICHNTIDLQYNEIMKAYGYGSSSNIYLIENVNMVMKTFNKKIRWTHTNYTNHCNYLEIFNRELSILKKLNEDVFNNSIMFYEDNMAIKMPYLGVSLYDDFILPTNWKSQLQIIFQAFTKNNVNYPEFNIKNIVVLNEKITLIDFGLASLVEDADNTINCDNFIELLDVLNNHFSTVKDNENKQVLYQIFINNIKNEKESKYEMNIF